MSNKFKLLILPITLVITLSGCISLTKELPSYTTYSLVDNSTNISNIKLDKTIRVYEPKALLSVNSIAISYSDENFINEKYALSKWSDKPSKMIQALISSSLTKTNNYKYINSSNIKISTDYNLITELDSFTHQFNKNSSMAKFSIRVYLIDNNSKKVYFKDFNYNKKSESKNAKDAVISLNYLVNTFLIDLNNFINASIQK